MKKTKIIAMMMTGALLMPMANVGKTTYAKEVVKTAVTATVENNREFISVKSNAKLVDANGKELSKVSTGDMAVKLGAKDGKTLVKLVKTGAEGYLEESSIMNITDGDVNKIEAKDTHGAIKNVDTFVNVRALPTMKSEVKDVLTNNTGVKILGKTGDWYQVNVGGVKGFIFGNYVEEGATGKVATTPSEAKTAHKDVVSKPNKGGNVTRPATPKKTTAKEHTSSNVVAHKVTTPKAEVKQNTVAPKAEVKAPVQRVEAKAEAKTEVKAPAQKTEAKAEVKQQTPAPKPEVKKEVVAPSQKTEVKAETPAQKTEVKKDEVKPSNPQQKEDKKEVVQEGSKEEIKPTTHKGQKDEVKPSTGKEEVKPSNPKKEEQKKPVEVKHEYNVPVVDFNPGDCLMDQKLTEKLNKKYGDGVYGNYRGEAERTMCATYTQLLGGQMSLDQAKKLLVGKYVEDGYQIKDIKMINMDIPQDEWAIYMDGSDYIEKHGGMKEFKADKQTDFFTMWNHNGDDQRHFTRVVYLLGK